MTERDLYDLTIIGGGPAGLFASFYAGLREMKVKVVDAQAQLGGKVSIYPEKVIWDVGGLTPMTGQQFVNQMVEQALTFEPKICLNEKALMIKEYEEYFEVETDLGRHFSKTILFAVGGGIIHPKKLAIPHLEHFELTNLHYHVKSIKQFKNQNLMISGGGATAVDWANELAPLAKSLTLVCRSEHLKAQEAIVAKLNQENIRVLKHTEIVDVFGEDDLIQNVVLKNNKNNLEETYAIDALLVNHGYERDCDLIENSPINIELNKHHYIMGNASGQSSKNGIYAAGDVLTYSGKLHLIAGAFQDAANAVNQAKKHIDPTAYDTAMVSSHHEIFAEKNKAYLYQ